MLNKDQLEKTAHAMVAPGKGILAADESTNTIKKRFASIGLESTAPRRRDYRELLFRTQKAMQSHISGVILYEETLKQRASDGTPLVKLIEASGAIPGIKVDTGTVPLHEGASELKTTGLDGLGERLRSYYELGARFAKWRAVLRIDQGLPSTEAVRENASALAQYAAHCQRREYCADCRARSVDGW